MRRTRVGLICGYWHPTRDGAADYTRRLAFHLDRIGFEPVVVTTYECARPAGGSVVGVTDRWDLRGVASAARAIRGLHFDVVHVQFAPSVFGSSRAIGMLPLFLPDGVPLVVTLHEYGVWSGHGTWGRASAALWSVAEGWGYADRETLLLVPRAAYVLVPSPEHLDVLRARSPRQPPATLEVPIGLNIDVVTSDRAEARVDVRHGLGAAPDAPVIAFFGFLHPEKALDRLITAVAALRSVHPDAHVLVIGGAESHSVPSAAAQQLRRELEQVAETSGMQGRVHFTGYLPGADVSRLLQAADVAAFPFNAGVTRKSSSLLTALAAGVPVVATANPGTIRAATEADGVFRVPPRDTAALTYGLDQILSDAALASRLTAAGRALAASHSWDTIAAAHSEVYARAVTSSGDGEPWTVAAEPKVRPR